MFRDFHVIFMLNDKLWYFYVMELFPLHLWQKLFSKCINQKHCFDKMICSMLTYLIDFWGYFKLNELKSWSFNIRNICFWLYIVTKNFDENHSLYKKITVFRRTCSHTLLKPKLIRFVLMVIFIFITLSLVRTENF